MLSNSSKILTHLDLWIQEQVNNNNNLLNLAFQLPTPKIILVSWVLNPSLISNNNNKIHLVHNYQINNKIAYLLIWMSVNLNLRSNNSSNKHLYLMPLEASNQRHQPLLSPPLNNQTFWTLEVLPHNQIMDQLNLNLINNNNNISQVIIHLVQTTVSQKVMSGQRDKIYLI